MEIVKRFLADLTVRRFIILAVICLSLFSIRDMLNLVLLTFLIAYIMNSFQKALSKRLSKFVVINSKVIIIFLYAAMVTMLVTAIINYWPKVFIQAKLT